MTLISLLGCSCLTAQETAAAADAPYVRRGNEVEEHRRAFHERLARLHTALSDSLRRAAPDLIAGLEPPPAAKHGYQVQPDLVADAEPAKIGDTAQVVRFGWAITDGLIAAEMTQLDRLEADLAALSSSPSAVSRAACKTLVDSYRKMVERRRRIDSNIDYNWLWQANIARDRALFDRLDEARKKALERGEIEAALASKNDDRLRDAARAAGFDENQTIEAIRDALTARSEAIARDVAAGRSLRASVAFVDIERASNQWVITVPLYTDVTDAVFIDAFERGVESVWHVRVAGADHTDEYRLQLAIETIAPQTLYCGGVTVETYGPPEPAPTTPCAPPATGSELDLEEHVRRFPAGGAVLTTGAKTLRLIDDRAIVLGPHDVSAHVLAHELGHVLGFPDAYFRGYRDLGADGFEVIELADLGDIMGAPGVGPVLPSHFEALAREKARAFLNRSLQLFEERRFEETIAAARAALDLRPEYPEAFNNLAAAYTELAMWNEAIAAAEEALRMKPDFQLARNNLEWARAERDKARGTDGGS